MSSDSGPKPVRILLVVHRYPPDIGGAERYAERLAMGFLKGGLEAGVVTSSSKNPRSASEVDIFELQPIFHRHIGYYLWPGVIRKRLWDCARHFDVVHVVDASMFSYLVGVLFKFILGKPLLLTSVYHPPEAMPHPRLKRMYDRLVLSKLLPLADAIISFSAREKETLLQHFPHLEGERIHVIANGPICFPSQVVRHSEGELGKEFTVGVVGRIDYHKGVDTVLAACKHLVEEGRIPFLSVKLIGQHEIWLTKHLTIPECLMGRVELTGWLDLPALEMAYSQCDVVVIASRYETFGFSIVEALGFGIPVVTTPVGIAPEVVSPGRNGFLYDYGDTKSLASAIETLYQVPPRTGIVSKSVSKFTWARTLSRTESLLTRLVEGSSLA